MAFVPWATPKYAEPRHLAPLVAQLERIARGERCEVVCHAPPRHGKSQTVTHAIPWLLQRRPEMRIAYATYGLRLSRKFTRQARDMAARIGIPLDLAKADEWTTREGGGLLRASVGAAITGEGVDLLIVDDPYPGRREAESANYREKVEEWFDEGLYSRVQPRGSTLVFCTRWHTKDLSGRLIADGWQDLRLPALDDDGRALWPEVWSAEELKAKKKRVGEYGWSSVYQGLPRPRGGELFAMGQQDTWTELPRVYRAAFGADLAYAAKTSKDYSVVVKMLKAGDRYFIVDVLRKQVKAAKFKRLCRKRHRLESSARWRWYTSTTEAGVADLFNEGSFPVPLEAVLAKGDKFTRAQAFAAAWNAGLVSVPASAPWLDDFLSELADFTGATADVDDQVDAAVAAFDLLAEDRDDDVDISPMPMKHTGIGALEL